jgi:hypothetical protein
MPLSPGLPLVAFQDKATDNGPSARQKDSAAAELGRKGGLKGGPARAAKLSANQPSKIAKKWLRHAGGKSSLYRTQCQKENGPPTTSIT